MFNNNLSQKKRRNPWDYTKGGNASATAAEPCNSFFSFPRRRHINKYIEYIFFSCQKRGILTQKGDVRVLFVVTTAADDGTLPPPSPSRSSYVRVRLYVHIRIWRCTSAGIAVVVLCNTAEFQNVTGRAHTFTCRGYAFTYIYIYIIYR